MGGGFCETSPSHSAKAVAAFPGAEDLLDPTAHAMDWLIPCMELAQRFLLVAAPHAGGDDPRCAALRAHGIPELIAAIGAVAQHFSVT